MQIDPTDFLSTQEVASKIEEALHEKRPFSLVRIGDGEALAMAQETILPITEIQKQSFLRYAGINVPNLAARDELITLLPKASIVGLPQRWDLPYFSPLVEKVLIYNQINLKTTCDCCINYYLKQSGLILPLFKRQRVILIGRRSRELATVLKDYHNISIVGYYIVDHYNQIPAIIRACRNDRFDIAFVSAGIPAVSICIKLAIQLEKVALDLGHLADRLIEEYL